MIEIIYNYAKYQKYYYYFVSRADIEAGAYYEAFKGLFEAGKIKGIQEYKDTLVITTTERTGAQVKSLALPKPKSKYTYSDIMDKLQIYTEFKK